MSDPMSPKRADRRYHRWFWPAMILYTGLCFGAPAVIHGFSLSGPWLYLAAMAPALPIGAVILVLGRWLRETDEYIRARHTEAMLYGWGFTGFFTVGYGFLEEFAGAPDYPLVMVLPMFLGLYGVARLFLGWRGR